MKTTSYGRIRKKSLSALQILVIIVAVVSIISVDVLPEAQNWRISGLNRKVDSAYHSKPSCPENAIKCVIRTKAIEYGVDPDTAISIAMAESSLNPLATNTNTNGTTDKGLFQINSIHGVPDECRLDVECNTDWAMQKMSTAGTTPWNSSKHKWK